MCGGQALPTLRAGRDRLPGPPDPPVVAEGAGRSPRETFSGRGVAGGLNGATDAAVGRLTGQAGATAKALTAG